MAEHTFEPGLDHNRALAAFVKEALGLAEPVDDLASEIIPFKRDINADISTIELDSSIGVAAFLIYHYDTSISDAEGRSGAELFDADVKVLERAATIDAPGPRIMAHAVSGDDAFILATSPATYRMLTGQPGAADAEADQSDRLPMTDTEEVRKEAASSLLTLLRQAESQATHWLAALQSVAPAEGEEASRQDETIEFNPEETELALFLLDDRSIQNLLRVLNLMIASAKELSDQARLPAPEA